MAELNLPADLIAFLQAGKQLEYDPKKCHAGAVTLLLLDQLKVELFPVDCEGTDLEEQDPNQEEGGCYLVEAVNLIASCANYEPVGLLLWLPLDGRYATWDGSHAHMGVFGPRVSWSQIVKAPAQHINAQWEGIYEDSTPASCFIPWTRHPWNAEQLYQPLPDMDEWYEANWSRQGVFKNGIQVRWPERIQVRLERNGDQCKIIGQVIDWDETGRRPGSLTARPLAPDEWKLLQTWLEEGFWQQPSEIQKPQGETHFTWEFAGFRDRTYRSFYRFYDDSGSGGDPAHQLGKRLADLAGLKGPEAIE